MAKDALAAHACDELGITEVSTARPVQAALASAPSFVSGGVWRVVAVALGVLAALGAAGARTGGAKIGPTIIRVVFWGALAMATTAAVGHLFGVAAG